jgi:hypothetical protein
MALLRVSFSQKINESVELIIEREMNMKQSAFKIITRERMSAIARNTVPCAAPAAMFNRRKTTFAAYMKEEKNNINFPVYTHSLSFFHRRHIHR